MKIIDAHLHFSKINSFKECAQNSSFVDYSAQGLIKELKENKVIAAVGMGLSENTPGSFPDKEVKSPLLLDLESNFPENLYSCPGINPHIIDLNKVENVLKEQNSVGLKIYAGYYHFSPLDKVYEAVYELAARYNKPIVIHTGDTYSPKALLKYSHPLQIDELAVTHKKNSFVIAHLGSPWFLDAAEVIYKNENVYGDLSGLLVGKNEALECMHNELFLNMIRQALIYANCYDKFLYGSDWPLISMKLYINFVKKLIPEKHQHKVFFDNALRVFNIEV